MGQRVVVMVTGKVQVQVIQSPASVTTRNGSTCWPPKDEDLALHETCR